MFETTTRPMSLTEIIGKIKSGKLRFDLEIQRRFCWSLDKKQELIDSLIFGYRVFEISFRNKNDDYMWGFDGQQRCMSIKEFYEDGYTLSMKCNNFEDYEGNIHKIAGLKYSELPESVRKILDARTITACKYSNATDEEISEQYRRMNNGEPMKKIEITRVDAGTEVMRFINDISNMEFFKDKTAIPEKKKIHFEDHEAILQTLVLLTNRNISFSGKDLQQFALDLKDGLLDESLKEKMVKVTEYLNEVFPESGNKYLKKTNLPVICKVVDLAIENNIDASDFFDWVNTFYSETIYDTEYNTKTQGGTATKSSVQDKLAILKADFISKLLNKPKSKKEPSNIPSNNNSLKKAISG